METGLGLGGDAQAPVRLGLWGRLCGPDTVLQALERVAQARGDREVLLHAQCSAEDFYTRNGYEARGAVFEEAGIRHIEMVKPMG